MFPELRPLPWQRQQFQWRRKTHRPPQSWALESCLGGGFCVVSCPRTALPHRAGIHYPPGDRPRVVQGGDDLVTCSPPAGCPSPGGFSHPLLVPTDMASGSQGQQQGGGAGLPAPHGAVSALLGCPPGPDPSHSLLPSCRPWPFRGCRTPEQCANLTCPHRGRFLNLPLLCAQGWGWGQPTVYTGFDVS